jgi:hypothetical protein
MRNLAEIELRIFLKILRRISDPQVPEGATESRNTPIRAGLRCLQPRNDGVFKASKHPRGVLPRAEAAGFGHLTSRSLEERDQDALQANSGREEYATQQGVTASSSQETEATGSYPRYVAAWVRE